MQNIEINEMFEMAFRFVTETNENIFLTGKAGTGKTTFLKYLQQHCAKNIIVAAPTGVAAINAGGVTLHSLFQLPFHPFLPTTHGKQELLGKLRLNRQRQDLLRKVDLLIIDEISMVRADLMDAIDTILRSVRRNHAEPFGGVQLLCIGDLHQLPPVAQHQEWSILQEYYSTPFFFDSLAIKEQMPLLIELNKIYRQKEDFFVSLLNKVRTNNMTADDLEDLNSRYNPNFHPARDENFITLTSHNRQADIINQAELSKLTNISFIYKAEVEGDFSENAYPAEKELELKVGAQVMFLKNDVLEKKYFNGKIGVIKHLEKERITVDCNGYDIEIGKETWENNRYSLNKEDGKLEQENLGTFTQYALRLAWAITIHKSQGLTFENLMIDAASAFSSGQVYVALSRCTSLEGIVLLSKIPPVAIISNDTVVKGQQNLTHKGSLAERFAGARVIFTQQVLRNIFSYKEISENVTLLEGLINFHREKLNDTAPQWILQIREQIARLQKVGISFITKVDEGLKSEPLIEQNENMQTRIADAANWFLPLLKELKQNIDNHPLLTEHREVSGPVNEGLHRLLHDIHLSLYLLEYCKNTFGITGFLQHRLKYALPKITTTPYAAGKKTGVPVQGENELLDTLFRWRNTVVEETGLPIFMVCNQATLKEISEYLPITKKDLLKIKGFGPAKVENYGDTIIDIVSDYCLLHGLKTNMDAMKQSLAKKKLRPDKKDTKTISFEMFEAGKSVSEIAAERSMVVGTIEGHLSYYIGIGKLLLDDFVSADKQTKILAVIKEHGLDKGFSHIKAQLGPEFTYSDIRFVAATVSKNVEESIET